MTTEAATYTEYAITLYPGWFRRRWGEAWISANAVLVDGLSALVVEATKVGIIKVAPIDALPFIGQERDLERYPSDTNEQYRARLSDAHPTYRKAGSDKAIRDEFARLGLTARVKRNNQWDYDGNPGNPPYLWARMWVIVDPPHDFVAGPGCGDPGLKCGTGVLCGIQSATGRSGAEVQADIARMLRLIRKWKSSHAKLVLLIIRFPSSGKLCGDAASVEAPATSPACGAVGLKTDSLSAYIHP